MTAITGRLTNEAEAIGDRHALLGLVAMGVLVLRLAKDHPAVDKKLLRQLLDLHTQAALWSCSVKLHTQHTQVQASEVCKHDGLCVHLLKRNKILFRMQVPLVPVFSEQMLQPASFLSQYLPSQLDPYIPAAYARQVSQLLLPYCFIIHHMMTIFLN